MVVPCEGSCLVKFGTACTRRIWLAGVLKVPDINLNDVSVERLQKRRKPTSPFVAPEDSKWLWSGLKPKPRTGPVWRVLRKSRHPEALQQQVKTYLRHGADVAYSVPSSIFAGSHIPSSPFSMPAARTPRGLALSTYPHAMRLNLGGVQ